MQVNCGTGGEEVRRLVVDSDRREVARMEDTTNTKKKISFSLFVLFAPVCLSLLSLLFLATSSN